MGQLSCGAAPAGERTEEQERETESRGPWERLGDGTVSAGGERGGGAGGTEGLWERGQRGIGECIAGRAGFFGVSSEQCGGWRWKAKGFRSVRGMRCVNRVRVAGGGDGVQSSPHQSMLRNSAAGEMWGPGARLQRAGQSPPFPSSSDPAGCLHLPPEVNQRDVSIALITLLCELFRLGPEGSPLSHSEQAGFSCLHRHHSLKGEGLSPPVSGQHCALAFLYII